MKWQKYLIISVFLYFVSVSAFSQVDSTIKDELITLTDSIDQHSMNIEYQLITYQNTIANLKILLAEANENEKKNTQEQKNLLEAQKKDYQELLTQHKELESIHKESEKLLKSSLLREKIYQISILVLGGIVVYNTLF